jgi:hypothetical protein
MAPDGEQVHSPTLSVVPSNSQKGWSAQRRMLTLSRRKKIIGKYDSDDLLDSTGVRCGFFEETIEQRKPFARSFEVLI